MSLSFPICNGGLMVQVLKDSAGEQGKAWPGSSEDADILAGRQRSLCPRAGGPGRLPGPRLRPSPPQPCRQSLLGPRAHQSQRLPRETLRDPQARRRELLESRGTSTNTVSQPVPEPDPAQRRFVHRRELALMECHPAATIRSELRLVGKAAPTHSRRESSLAPGQAGNPTEGPLPGPTRP